MYYYDNEVLVIPANRTINAVKDKACGIYECPVKKGHFSARATSHPLYIAFKANGMVTTLYKVQDIVQLDIANPKDIDALDSIVENDRKKYPDFKERIDKYKKYFPKVLGVKWVFLLDTANSIELYNPAVIPSGARGNEYRTLREFFNSPISVLDGRVVVTLKAKGTIGKSAVKTTPKP